MVRRSAPKEAPDRLRQGMPPHSGKVSNAAPYLEPKGESGQEHGVTSPLKLQSQKSEGGQQGRLWLRQDCLNPNRGGTRASPGNGTIAQV